MANTTIKTRILLRNDTLSNWGSSSLVLAKGELAIATIDGNLAEVRVGTGSSTWANSLKLNVQADQISGLIETIQGTSKKYQIVANGEGGNSWKLQEAALSGGNWTDVSTFTVDFTAVATDIAYLSSQISSTQGDITAIASTLNTVSSDYLTSADKTALSNALTALDDAKLAKTDFAALSNEIGLSAATASNQVVTKKDIADLAGAMHFRGAVTPEGTETDLEALARAITDPASGDVAIITTSSKEYVYNGTAWIELGDEVLYATKAEVSTLSATLTGDIAGLTADVDYLSGQIGGVAATLNTVSSDYLTSADKTELTTLIGTVSAETLVSANAYTDAAIATLSGDYALSADVDSLVAEVSAATYEAAYTSAYTDAKAYADGLSATVSTDYMTKTDVSTLVGAVSVETAVSAYGASKDYVDGILSGFLVLDCGGAGLRSGEPQAPLGV